MSWIRKAFLISIIFLLMFELFSFAASKAGLLIVNDAPTYSMDPLKGQRWRNEKQPWGAWHKPDAADRHVKSCFSISYRSNDVGARDTRDYLDLEEENNVAVIGDSFVEGFGVNKEETFAHKLKDKYGKRGLNFGASGNSGPVQQYLLYEGLVSRIPHNEVVFFFLPRNDFEDNSDKRISKSPHRYRPYFSRSGKDDVYEIIYPPDAVPSENYPSGSDGEDLFNLKTFFIGYTWSANAVRTISYLRKYRLKSLFSSQSYEVKDSWENNYSYFTGDQYEVDGAMYFVDKLLASVPAEYRKTIIVIPSMGDLHNILERGWEYKNLDWYKQLESIAEKYRAGFVDLALDEKNEESRKYIEEGLASWFLECDGHWSDAGHDMAINRFLKYSRSVFQ